MERGIKMLEVEDVSKLDIGRMKDDLLSDMRRVLDVQQELFGKPSTVDRKICDVQHHIELVDNLNASEGFQAYRMLKDLLRERREVKNRISEISAFADLIGSSSLIKNERKTKKISSITDTRVYRNKNADKEKIYRVRELHNVFGNVIKNR